MVSSAGYDLLGEREFYPFALHKTVIPAHFSRHSRESGNPPRRALHSSNRR